NRLFTRMGETAKRAPKVKDSLGADKAADIADHCPVWRESQRGPGGRLPLRVQRFTPAGAQLNAHASGSQAGKALRRNSRPHPQIRGVLTVEGEYVVGPRTQHAFNERVGAARNPLRESNRT